MISIKLKALLLSLLFTTTLINAETMFTLSGIKKVYPLVEISGAKISQKYKELNSTLDTLGINTKGFDQRAIALLISESYADKLTLINMQLLIGEQVKRVDSNETVFAMTYQDKEDFVFENSDDIDESIEDTLDTLLDKFATQYKADNQSIVKVKIDETNTTKTDFATQLGYETNYETALKKAKEMKKNVLFVLVANYCPWCRKFEQRVLLKEEVNRAIHQKYIPLILNREKGEFPEEFRKAMTPIVHFIDYKTGKSYHNVVGYNNREEFLHLLESDK